MTRNAVKPGEAATDGGGDQGSPLAPFEQAIIGRLDLILQELREIFRELEGRIQPRL